ncbi:MAG: amidohydrolase family protein [Dehalococcoidia bacterium]|nr:amidohydrolase family protein [Dehalococcoidia bacterium]
MVIDFHTHIVPPRVKQNREDYAHADRSFAAIFSDPEAKLATADDLIAVMDRDGVDIAVTLNYGWSKQSLCVEINDYICESVARFPKRLVGFCTVAPPAGDAALREVERCIKGGVRGVGEIRPDILPAKTRMKLLMPLLEFVTAKGLILLTHASEPVGHNYPGKGTATPDVIIEMVGAFPDIKLVCAHWGGGLPFYALMPEIKKALKNVWFDTAASPFLYTPQVYQKVTQLVGEDKVLFGSDYPLIPPRRYFKEMDAAALPGKMKHSILAGNASRLLGIRGEN